MAGDGNGDLLYDLTDEVGLDVDRFRLVEGASTEQLYLTGIELALAAAGWMGARFLRGFVRGLSKGATEAGLDPEVIGEKLGQGTLKTLAARAEQLGQRTAALVRSPPQEVRAAAPEVEAELEQTLHLALTMSAELPESTGAESSAEGRSEIVALLKENGFDQERADDLATRLANRLTQV